MNLFRADFPVSLMGIFYRRRNKPNFVVPFLYINKIWENIF